MLILGIESSCDDTSVALVEATAPTSPRPLPASPAGRLGQEGSFRIIAEKTASQIEIHQKYGGVVPEIAGRMHAEKIVPLIQSVLNLSVPTLRRDTSPYKGEGRVRPDVIAVTAGPGLITGLIVGVEAARTLSYAWDIPAVAVNHLEGHICSVEIKDANSKKQTDNKSNIQYPALALVVSGGHTELILISGQPARHASTGVAGGGKYKKIGATLDDAAGECFDKVAKLLGLTYPGGPQISKLATKGNPDAINFPRPMIRENSYNFSFSGLKTSALYWLRDNTDGTYDLRLTTYSLEDFCASFEQAIIDVLVAKTLQAVEKYRPRSVILAGGVSANKKLRATLKKEVKLHSPLSAFHSPPSTYCMDNAAMIAVAGYYHALKKDFTPWQKLAADPNWQLA